jgi:hypothetical protein
MVEYYFTSMFGILNHQTHTKPSTAEIRNLTQSIGVKLGFIFSGYINSNNVERKQIEHAKINMLRSHMKHKSRNLYYQD